MFLSYRQQHAGKEHNKKVSVQPERVKTVSKYHTGNN
jgi:hypothetical protein